ncbi:hypothetical protein I8Y06_003294 [Photobacterium damselae]|nr:hypothetical protein [Photobacterium damselae]
MKKAICAIAIALTGCQSTNIEPKVIPFETNASYAYNVANQTALTKDKSKLRDFTKIEVEEFKKINLVGGNAGSASMFFGSLSLITGNFASAAIDLAGGMAADMSMGKHISGISRFIVAEKAKEIDQSENINSEIRKAIERVLNKHGAYTIKTVQFDDQTQDFIVGGKCTDPTVFSEQLKNKLAYFVESMDYGSNQVWCRTGGFSSPMLDVSYFNYETNLISPKKVTSNYGFDKMYAPYGQLSYIGILTALNQELTTNNYNNFLKELSGELPTGYFIYKTNFQKERSSIDGRYYTIPDFIPAIFHNGKQFDFIQN